MLASFVSPNGASCYLLSPSQSTSSWYCLGRLRRPRSSFLGTFQVDSDKLVSFSRYEKPSQQMHDSREIPAANGSMGSVTATGLCVHAKRAIHFQGNGRRRFLTPSTTICYSSSAEIPTMPFELMDADEFVEIGTIADTHGLYGELRVRSLTDFPEERFETPGVRYIRRMMMGKPSLRHVELLEGRESFGKQSSWLVTLKGFDTSEKASELLGATMLVRADERPSLEDDEEYIPDLVGMSVILQDTRKEIGKIMDVHSSGASDLLRVRLNSSSKGKDVRIWIPFVKEIVPLVDNKARRVEITPPEGLLELNVPKEGLSKKDIRKQERKKKAILATIRKRLTALGQTHVLEGLSTGDDSQRQALMDQLMSVDFNVFQRALQGALADSKLQQLEPEPPPPFSRANWSDFETWTNVKTYKKRPVNSENDTARWWFKGLQLVANGEVAVVVLGGGQSTRLGPGCPPAKGMLELNLPEPNSLFGLQAERIRLVQKLAALNLTKGGLQLMGMPTTLRIFPKGTQIWKATTLFEVNASYELLEPESICSLQGGRVLLGAHPGPIPRITWLVMTSDATDTSTRAFFEQKDFFGLEKSQVWFFKQQSLPCVDRQEGHSILLESPWKVSLAPSGNGGLFSALHTQGCIERLSDEGVKYIQVYSVDNALVRVADPVFFGYAHERKADIGVKVVNRGNSDESLGVVCLQKSAQEPISAKDGTADRGDLEELEIDDVEEEEEDEEKKKFTAGDPGVSYCHYSVLEYTEIPSLLRAARDGDEFMYGAAHICVNLFSLEYLKKMAEARFQLGFHMASKRIPCTQKDESGRVAVSTNQPNGIKLEQFIFDAFKYCEWEKVALLEVDRAEEFAPIKNAEGQGVSDTATTAQEMMLSLRDRLASQTDEPEIHQDNGALSLLRAFYSGARMN